MLHPFLIFSHSILTITLCYRYYYYKVFKGNRTLERLGSLPRDSQPELADPQSGCTNMHADSDTDRQTQGPRLS